MFKIVARVALLSLVVATIVAAFRGAPILDMIILFVFGGIFPGTKFVVPDELTMLLAAGTLAMISTRLYQSHVRNRSKLQALLPEYDLGKEDPSYSAIVPALGRLMTMGQTFKTRADIRPSHLRAWFRHFGPPTRVVSMNAARETARYTAMRLSMLQADGMGRYNYGHGSFVGVRRRVHKLRMYLGRATMI